MTTIHERFEQKFTKSKEMFEQGRDLIPGGGHQTRAVRPFPIYVEHGKGGLKWDVDGNEIVDYMMGYGALILGIGHPKISEAVSRRVDRGTHMGTLTPLELRWAELVKRLIPSAERVRFTNTGSESTALAIRLARAYTGKTKLMKFREHYHGNHDYVSLQSGINTQAGIPKETLSTVVVVEPQISAVEQALAQDKDIAAVILEPTGGHWGQYPLQNPRFLHELRDVTTRNGVVMIMDEVITGFRASRGGAQARFNVTPDLTTMAKIVGGGLPAGAIAGKAEIMELVSPENTTGNRVPHVGTYNANPLSASAGIACLELVANEPINERADAMAQRLKVGLREALSRTEVPGHVHGIASMLHVVLGVDCDCDGEICTMPHSRLAEANVPQRTELFKLAMLNEGVDMMGGIGFMVSAAHTEQEIDRTAAAFESALGALRQEGAL